MDIRMGQPTLRYLENHSCWNDFYLLFDLTRRTALLTKCWRYDGAAHASRRPLACMGALLEVEYGSSTDRQVVANCLAPRLERSSVSCDSVKTEQKPGASGLDREPEWFLDIAIKVSYFRIHRGKKRTQGTETSKYLQERTSTETP